MLGHPRAAPEGLGPRDVTAGVREATSNGSRVTNPGRFLFLLQRAVPGFTPSPASPRCSAESHQVMQERAASAGVRDAGHVDVPRALINGLASEQIAHEPGRTPLHLPSQTCRDSHSDEVNEAPIERPVARNFPEAERHVTSRKGHYPKRRSTT